jgi:hypothetical protein
MNEKSDRIMNNYPNNNHSGGSVGHSSVDETETIIEIEHDPRTSSAGAYGEADGNAVDIDNALQEYRSVQREFTQRSRRSSIGAKSVDLEKGVTAIGDDVQEFDLTEYLSDQHTQLTAAGLKSKNMGVIWKNLKVQGLGANARSIATNWSVVSDTLKFWKWKRHSGTDFTILNDNDGFCKSGEMLLVLGRPGAGKLLTL